MTLRLQQLGSTFGFVLLLVSLASCSHFQSSVASENFSTPGATKTENQPAPARDVASDGGQVPVLQDATFDWPVDSARMTRGFLPHKRKPHLGIDLAAGKGTPILASRSGTVIYAGHEFHGYGRMVLIESGEGWAALYAHFDKILVVEGQKVRKGEVIGAMGRSGHATGVHLHFEIRHNRGPVDPLPLLPHTATAKN